jgi:hypothetical protein
MYGPSLVLMAYSAILREKFFEQSAKELGAPVDVVLVNGLVSCSQVCLQHRFKSLQMHASGCLSCDTLSCMASVSC